MCEHLVSTTSKGCPYNKGLEYFKTQKNLSDRQVWWWEFLSCFNYTIMHIDGVDNKVADCLSCYYENDTSNNTVSNKTIAMFYTLVLIC